MDDGISTGYLDDGIRPDAILADDDFDVDAGTAYLGAGIRPDTDTKCDLIDGVKITVSVAQVDAALPDCRC